jgi:site-specific DNA recombinase
MQVEWHEPELDVSGSKRNRAILDAIVAKIERGELAGIIVYNLSRLSRLAPRDRIELVERIEAAGGVILSACESFDATTPEGRFQRDLFFSIARMEWEKAAEGFAVAKAAAVERGTKISVMAPYGYKFGPGHRLVADEDEAPILVELFRLRAAGASRGEILDVFEQRTGRLSSRQSIRYMLRNRVYLGEVHYGRNGSTLVNAAAHEPLVDADLFEDVQRVDRERAGGPRSGGRPRALLAGIARCACCKRNLTRSPSTGARLDTYKCPNDSRRCAARASIGADELDAYVEAEILAWAGEVADELVEVELGESLRGGPMPRALLEERLERGRALLVEHETNVELELKIGSIAYEAGRRARVAYVAKCERELELADDWTEAEIARVTLREMLDGDPANGELEVAARRRLLGVVLDAVDVRRTPRRYAPASERATLVFRGGGGGRRRSTRMARSSSSRRRRRSSLIAGTIPVAVDKDPEADRAPALAAQEHGGERDDRERDDDHGGDEDNPDPVADVHSGGTPASPKAVCMLIATVA